MTWRLEILEAGRDNDYTSLVTDTKTGLTFHEAQSEALTWILGAIEHYTSSRNDVDRGDEGALLSSIEDYMTAANELRRQWDFNDDAESDADHPDYVVDVQFQGIRIQLTKEN